MTGDDERPQPAPAFRIERCPETGRIRLHRRTPLGTVTETLDR